MNRPRTISVHCVDSSALVKIFVTEQGSEHVQAYFGKQGVIAISAITFAETLGVLKMKWLRAEITQEQYLAVSEELVASFRDETIQIYDSFPINSGEAFKLGESLCRKYKLDLADSLQLVAMKEGFFAAFEGDSRPIMVTADSGLSYAARNEGLRVWHCLETKRPEC